MTYNDRTEWKGVWIEVGYVNQCKLIYKCLLPNGGMRKGDQDGNREWELLGGRGRGRGRERVRRGEGA
jgi:hypothetical protein